MKSVPRLLIILTIAVLAFLSPDLLPGLFDDNITIVVVNNKTLKGGGIGFFKDDKNILTAAHIVEPEGNAAIVGDIEILDERGRIHPAKVVGVDTDSDIAILNITDTYGFKPKTPCSRYVRIKELLSREVFYSKIYGYSRLRVLLDSLKIMSPSYHKGELLGPEWKLEDPAVMYIMHDSAIIPGYSGSPLLDSNDCYLGMNVTVDMRRPKISHAVSLATIEEVSPKLIKSGKVDMPFIGIFLEQTANRVFISGAVENSPGSILNKYGVKILNNSTKELTYPALELIFINNERITRFDEAWKVLKLLPPGSPITLMIKDFSGKLESVIIISGDRFSMMRKYIPASRFSSTPRILVI